MLLSLKVKTFFYNCELKQCLTLVYNEHEIKIIINKRETKTSANDTPALRPIIYLLTAYSKEDLRNIQRFVVLQTKNTRTHIDIGVGIPKRMCIVEVHFHTRRKVRHGI